MLLNRIVVLSLFPAALLSAQAAPMQPAYGEAPAAISSSATSEAKFTPDRATISVAVQTRATTAAAAAAENATKQNAVMASLRSLGIPNDQLSTTGYSVSPEYRYDPNSTPTLTGYTVTNTVLVDVHDLKQIGKLLDTVISHGSNLISSLDFYSSNTDAAQQQALTSAVRKARAEADVAARAAGGSLGSLIHMSVGGQGAAPPPRPMFMAKSMVAGAADTQISPGQQTLSMTVSGSWHFIPNP